MNGGPAVVLPFLDNVDFVTASRSIESAWSMFRLKHQVRSRLPVHPLRVAMTQRPDLGPRVLLAHKRIVLRHGAVVVQTKRLAREGAELLSQRALGRIASRAI